jgi:hypothetical protein
VKELVVVTGELQMMKLLCKYLCYHFSQSWQNSTDNMLVILQCYVTSIYIYICSFLPSKLRDTVEPVTESDKNVVVEKQLGEENAGHDNKENPVNESEEKEAEDKVNHLIVQDF